ncbi:MAG: hypothetical protein CBC34_011905 [Hyphomicrobiaceae bacterium TMED74]|nr:hypothetical protein [Filomicrobium sp.]RPG40642.1 MAG: hypothetical protein CBC34_011905 [Hyphomicrobiaceae bacterium TMED74]
MIVLGLSWRLWISAAAFVERYNVNGTTASVDGLNGSVSIEGASVFAADVGASNGVIHVIDAVIIPGS